MARRSPIRRVGSGESIAAKPSAAAPQPPKSQACSVMRAVPRWPAGPTYQPAVTHKPIVGLDGRCARSRRTRSRSHSRPELLGNEPLPTTRFHQQPSHSAAASDGDRGNNGPPSDVICEASLRPDWKAAREGPMDVSNVSSWSWRGTGRWTSRPAALALVLGLTLTACAGGSTGSSLPTVTASPIRATQLPSAATLPPNLTCEPVTDGGSPGD